MVESAPVPAGNLHATARCPVLLYRSARARVRLPPATAEHVEMPAQRDCPALRERAFVPRRDTYLAAAHVSMAKRTSRTAGNAGQLAQHLTVERVSPASTTPTPVPPLPPTTTVASPKRTANFPIRLAAAFAWTGARRQTAGAVTRPVQSTRFAPAPATPADLLVAPRLSVPPDKSTAGMTAAVRARQATSSTAEGAGTYAATAKSRL